MKEEGISSRRSLGLQCADAQERPAGEWVFVVMATSGEWSDRSEWPVCAVWTEDAAQAKAEELTDRVAAARAFAGPSPAFGAGDAAWEAFWPREEAAMETIKDIGGSDLDLSFFTYKVPLSSEALPSVSPLGGEGKEALDESTLQNPSPRDGGMT